MVLNFLWLQSNRDAFPGVNRRILVFMITAGNKKGKTTAQRIVQWENSWVSQRVIPERKNRAACNESWMNEEDILFAAREFIKTQGEGKLLKR